MIPLVDLALLGAIRQVTHLLFLYLETPVFVRLRVYLVVFLSYLSWGGTLVCSAACYYAWLDTIGSS